MQHPWHDGIISAWWCHYIRDAAHGDVAPPSTPGGLPPSGWKIGPGNLSFSLGSGASCLKWLSDQQVYLTQNNAVRGTIQTVSPWPVNGIQRRMCQIGWRELETWFIRPLHNLFNNSFSVCLWANVLPYPSHLWTLCGCSFTSPRNRSGINGYAGIIVVFYGVTGLLFCYC